MSGRPRFGGSQAGAKWSAQVMGLPAINLSFEWIYRADEGGRRGGAPPDVPGIVLGAG